MPGTLFFLRNGHTLFIAEVTTERVQIGKEEKKCQRELAGNSYLRPKCIHAILKVAKREEECTRKIGCFSICARSEIVK